MNSTAIERFFRSVHVLVLVAWVPACNPVPAPDVPPVDASSERDDDAVDASVSDDWGPDASAGCYLPGYGLCPRESSCVTGHCANGTPVSCYCTRDGDPLCTGLCAPVDAGPACLLPNGDSCARGMDCLIGHCLGGEPITCHCNDDGRVLCTGACPPPGGDSGVSCGEAVGQIHSDACKPAALELDTRTCRCILGYFWDGHDCVASSNCRCFRNCDQLYTDRSACLAAYAGCAR